MKTKVVIYKNTEFRAIQIPIDCPTDSFENLKGYVKGKIDSDFSGFNEAEGDILWDKNCKTGEIAEVKVLAVKNALPDIVGVYAVEDVENTTSNIL